MSHRQQTRQQQVEITCVGSPPVERIQRASGVSAVVVHGLVLRCVVTGSFQPFLEALHGHEVLSLQSVPATDPLTPSTN